MKEGLEVNIVRLPASINAFYYRPHLSSYSEQRSGCERRIHADRRKEDRMGTSERRQQKDRRSSEVLKKS